MTFLPLILYIGASLCTCLAIFLIWARFDSALLDEGSESE